MKDNGDTTKNSINNVEQTPKSNISSAFKHKTNPGTEPSTKKEVKKEKDHLKEISELKEALVRALAENDNIKKRHAKDIESTLKYGITNTLKDLIDPFEQLFMALNVKVQDDIQNHESFKAVVDGIEITRKSFEVAFEKHGLKRIYPKGEPFNHDIHQAVSQIKQDGVQSGIVIDVVQAGYILNGRVIKPAMVIVSL